MLLSGMLLSTRRSGMSSSIFKQDAITQRVQQGPCPCAGEDEDKVALGIDVEVGVPRYIGAQHELLHFVLLAVKENVQPPAAQVSGSPHTRTGTARQTADLEVGGIAWDAG